ncbi:uncharacterized protein LOC111250863 [Varroa destructor]|uniref:Uncharacterized protein n=1 Tax=Varroa destructor TaxID=109461 RepID=A0A7M7MAR5_VARDE|nr:uncharacterized protein LOC111250863 [Varroa destructor]
MCSLQEPFGTLAIAGDMRGAGGSLLAAGPSGDTVIASVSPSCVALLRPDYSQPIRSWFSKPSTPFTTTAVWDSVNNKLVSASQTKVLAWTNSEKAVPTVVADCQSDVLCFVPYSAGVAVICKNGLTFQLQYERPNWEVQMSPAVRGTFSWAAILELNGKTVVLLVAEDGKSVARFPLGDPNSKATIKLPAKFTITACCTHNNTLFVGNSQGKVLLLDEELLIPSKIDLKLEEPDHLTALISCDRDILVASQTQVSLWDIQFGLMKASIRIAFSPWVNKCLFYNGNKALLVHTSLMVLPMKIQKWSLAALTGSKKRKSEKKATGCAELCNSFVSQVDNWSPTDMQRYLQQVDDHSEVLIVKCWKRILNVDPNHQAIVNKLLITRHECHKLTAVLHESLSMEEVQRSIDLLASCMAQVTLVQLGGGVLEALMDWACHLVDAHRNALKVSLRSENESINGCLLKLEKSLRRIEGLSQDLVDSQYNLKVALDKIDRIAVPREKLYWVEPWPFLNNKSS